MALGDSYVHFIAFWGLNAVFGAYMKQVNGFYCIVYFALGG